MIKQKKHNTNRKIYLQSLRKKDPYSEISGLYFPAFRLTTERHGVSLLIPFECREKRTRKTPNTDTFHAVNLNQENKKFYRSGDETVQSGKEPSSEESHESKKITGTIIFGDSINKGLFRIL